MIVGRGEKKNESGVAVGQYRRQVGSIINATQPAGEFGAACAGTGEHLHEHGRDD
jgi:hypothetical protein